MSLISKAKARVSEVRDRRPLVDHFARTIDHYGDINGSAPPENRPGCGRHTTITRFEFGEMLVIGQAAQDRCRPDIRQADTGAEQRQHHFRIEETATIEQRKHEIDALWLGQFCGPCQRRDVCPDPLDRREA